MAVVTITEPKVGDVINTTALNNTLTSWNSGSTDIDEENVADEGLDRRNFDWSTRPVIELMGQTRGTFTGTNTTSGSSSIFVTLTGLALDEDDDDEAWEVSFTGMLTSRRPVVIASSATAPHDTAPLVFNVQLFYRDSPSGSWVAIPHTLRQYQLRWSVDPGEVAIKSSIAIFTNLRAHVAASWGSSNTEVGVSIWESYYSTRGSALSSAAEVDVSGYELTVVKVKR